MFDSIPKIQEVSQCSYVCFMEAASGWPHGHKDREHRKGPSSVTSPPGQLAASDSTAQRIILLACVSGGCKVSSWGPGSWDFVMWLQDIEGQAMKAPGRDAEPGKPQEKVGIWGPRTGRCSRTCRDSGGSVPSPAGAMLPHQPPSCPETPGRSGRHTACPGDAGSRTHGRRPAPHRGPGPIASARVTPE